MALSNYSDLLSALDVEAIRTDQASYWPIAIAKAEAEISRKLIAADASGKVQVIRPMVATATVTVSAEYGAFPADMLRPIALDLQTGITTNPTKRLLPVNPDTLVRMNEDKTAYQSLLIQLFGTTPAPPGWYAVVGPNFRFFPAPQTTYTAILTYMQAIPGLQANATNWLMTAHPDVYVNGALAQYGLKVQDARTEGWVQAFLDGIQGIKDHYPTESLDARLRTDVGIQNVFRNRRSGWF